MTITVPAEHFYLFTDVGVNRELTLVDETEQSSSTDEGGNTDGE